MTPPVAEPGPLLSHNTLVVAIGVAAVGFGGGVVGGLALLRKRPLVGDAAAHATLAGVASAFLLTGRRDLPTLLGGALAAALAALAALVLVRRYTRTREDAATALVIGVSFGIGVALLSGITARGLPGGTGLEQYLLGHTAALTVRDAVLLAAASTAAVAVVAALLKESVVVAFDAGFAAATGWPVGLIDTALVGLVAVMVVVGLPAAGAVLVTALVVIPPVAARQWTERVAPLLALSGCIGLGAAVAGVAASAALPRLSTGPLVVLAAAAAAAVSFVAAPRRGWLARRFAEDARRGRWMRGVVLEECLRRQEGHAGFARPAPEEIPGGAARGVTGAWNALVRERLVAPADGGWRLTAAGRDAAVERRRRIAAWEAAFDETPPRARDAFTVDIPAPEDSSAGCAAEARK